jgi:hypothetical protein
VQNHLKLTCRIFFVAICLNHQRYLNFMSKQVTISECVRFPPTWDLGVPGGRRSVRTGRAMSTVPETEMAVTSSLRPLFRQHVVKIHESGMPSQLRSINPCGSVPDTAVPRHPGPPFQNWGNVQSTSGLPARANPLQSVPMPSSEPPLPP